MSKTENKAAEEMTEARNILFISNMPISLTCKLDQMGSRIEDLEKNVSELMTQAGMEKESGSK
uniref:Heat shock factor binding protein 1b n=1 Tax=Cyprinodon variegatus TaxID=28743 RepID=A0A3Q2CZU4_CYPVA